MSWKPQPVLGSVCSCGWAAQQGWGAPQPPPAGWGVGAGRSIPLQKLYANYSRPAGRPKATSLGRFLPKSVIMPSPRLPEPRLPFCKVGWSFPAFQGFLHRTGKNNTNTKASPLIPQCFPG